MLFEDIEKAADSFTIAFDFMEKTWLDEQGVAFRPRRQDILEMLRSMRASLEADEGKHDYIKSNGLMVDLTDRGNLIYRLEPEFEFVYRMTTDRCKGAKLEWTGDGYDGDDFPWEK
jgi:hypothetical protein